MAGLGTTTILIASSLLLLLVVSALVAFDAWPDTGGLGDRVERIFVGDDSQPVTLNGPQQVALDAAPAAAAVASAPAPGTVAVLPDGTPVGVPPAPGGQGPAGGGASPDGGTGTIKRQLSETTRGVTDGVGRTVGQVDPNLGKTVSETGRELSTIVEGLPDVQPKSLVP